MVDYPNNAPAGSSQANAAMPGYGGPLRTNFSYAAGLADAVRNAASFFGNIFSFGTLGGSSPSTSSSPTAAPTAATSPTSTTTPGATTPREAAAARTGPPAQPTYSVTGTAGKTGTTTAAPAAAPLAEQGYAAGLGISEAKAPVDVSNFTDTKFADAADFRPAPAAAVPGAGVEAAHQAISATSKPGAAAPAPKPIGGEVLPAEGVNGFVFHHTAGGGTPEGVINTLQERGLGVEYIMDRDGTIYRTPWGAGAAQVGRTSGPKGAGLSNANTYGMEIIAKDDADVTPAQVASAQAFMATYYPNTPVFGHGEVSPGRKQATEGLTVANSIRNGPLGIDPFANATTYGAGGPARGGNFTRDPQGNPVPPADIPGGQRVPPGLATGSAPAYTTLATGSPELGVNALPPVIAAAVIGNIQQESSFNPGAKGKAGETGLGQWDANRWASAQAWAASNGLDINDPRTQTLFYSHELQSDPNTWSRLQAARTPAEAASIIATHFERAGNPQTSKRAAYADAALGAYGTGGAAEAKAAPSGPGGVDYSIPGAGFGQPEAYAAPAAPAVAKPAAAPATTGKQPSLKIGSSGPAVRDLQQQLLNAGYNPGPLDGDFGQRTRDALFKFQEAHPGTGTRFGYSDAVAGPKTRAALAAATAGRKDLPVPTPRERPQRPLNIPGGTIFPPDGRIGPSYAESGDATLKGGGPILPSTGGAISAPPGGYAAGITPTPVPLGGTQVFGPGQTGEPAPQPPAGPNFDETFNAPMPLPGQELTPEQGAGTMATRADLRDRLPGAAATAGAGYYRGLQSVEEDRASRARIPETVASTYAAITGGGSTDQFAGGPTGGIPPPPPSFATNPAAVGANIGAASAAAPPASSGYVPTPYRDPGMEPDRLDRLRQEIRPAGALGPQALFVGRPPQGPFNTGRERLKGAMDRTVPGGPPGPELQRPMEDLRTRPDGTPDAPNRVIADAGAAALTAPEPDVVRTLASLPPEGQAQYRSGFVNNIIDSIDQAGDARGILQAIDASPQASRRLEVVLGPQGASQFKSLVRVDGIGNREPGTRFAAALPSMAGIRGSPPVDSQVAARVGALLDSDDPAEFSRGLKIVAANPNLQALVQRVDAMV